MMNRQGFTPGDRVFIACGTYKGSYSHVLRVMSCKASILVDLDGKSHDLWKTSLHFQSPTRPTTSVAAILHEYPDLDEQIEDVCYHIARCSIDPQSPELVTILQEKILKHEIEMKPNERLKLPCWIRLIMRCESGTANYVSDGD